MELPKDVTDGINFKTLMISGGAFKCVIPQFDSKYRFYFVLNLSPDSDEVILVATTTTQIENTQKKFHSEVLVSLTHDDYKPLSKDSLINCEYAKAIKKTRLQEILRTSGKYEILDALPETLANRLRVAVSKCKMLSPLDKELVLGKKFQF